MYFWMLVLLLQIYCRKLCVQFFFHEYWFDGRKYSKIIFYWFHHWNERFFFWYFLLLVSLLTLIINEKCQQANIRQTTQASTNPISLRARHACMCEWIFSFLFFCHSSWIIFYIFFCVDVNKWKWKHTCKKKTGYKETREKKINQNIIWTYCIDEFK